MKKRIIRFMVLVGMLSAPLCADIYKTRLEIVRLMTEHEGLSDQDQAQLAQLLQNPILDERIPYASFSESAKIAINDNMLRVLKPFAKTPDNPLFQECLFNAIRLGSNNRVRKLVSSFGVGANTVWEGKTALHEAMMAEIDQRGAVSIVNFLLENGAELEARDQEEGLTPLGYAVRMVPTPKNIEYKKEKIAALVSRGAKLDAVNAQGESMLWVLERGYSHYCRINQQLYQDMGMEEPFACEGTRKNVEKIYEIPAVAEKIMEHEEPVLGVFLPKSLGNLVMEYEHPHLAAIQPYTGEDLERDLAPFLAQRGDAADGGPERDSVGIAGIGAAGAPVVDANLAGASVFDFDEVLEGEPAGVPYLP